MKINAKRFSKVMRTMARLPAIASKEIAREITAEMLKRMDAGQDPYGKPWKLKSDGSRSKLLKSGAGRASIEIVPTAGSGIRITVSLLYMIYHQFGGKSHLRGHRKNKNFGRDKDRSLGRNKPPTRSFIPFDRLPVRWDRIIELALEHAARKVLRG